MNKRPYFFKLDELNAHDIEMANRVSRRRFIGAGGAAIGAALAGCAAPPVRLTPATTAGTRMMQGVLSNTYKLSGPPNRLTVEAATTIYSITMDANGASAAPSLRLEVK